MVLKTLSDGAGTRNIGCLSGCAAGGWGVKFWTSSVLVAGSTLNPFVLTFCFDGLEGTFSLNEVLSV